MIVQTINAKSRVLQDEGGQKEVGGYSNRWEEPQDWSPADRDTDDASGKGRGLHGALGDGATQRSLSGR